MIDRCRSALPVAASAYLALLPSNAVSFWRSLAFGIAAVLALALIAASLRERRHAIPSPGIGILAAFAAWAGWALASLAWSSDAAFTLRELKSDVLWGVATLAIFYVAATTSEGRRWTTSAILAGLAFWPALAIGLHFSALGWDSRLAHMGVVAYATYLVTVAPFLLLLAWRPPTGVAGGTRGVAVALLLFALLLVTARMSENRVVWIALAASLCVLVIALRATLPAKRAAIGTAVLIAAFALLFADAARNRAATDYGPAATVPGTLAVDPRIGIWQHAAKHIAARPWHGYGYGRLILKDELRADTGDRLLTHPHNTFVSQWLQTGAIGVGLFLALLGVLAARYLKLVRTGDEALMRLGAIGLAVLAGFVVKNLTDDFFFRANLKLFFAVNAMLLGATALALRERDALAPPRRPQR